MVPCARPRGQGDLHARRGHCDHADPRRPLSALAAILILASLRVTAQGYPPLAFPCDTSPIHVPLASYVYEGHNHFDFCTAVGVQQARIEIEGQIYELAGLTNHAALIGPLRMTDQPGRRIYEAPFDTGVLGSKRVSVQVRFGANWEPWSPATWVAFSVATPHTLTQRPSAPRNVRVGR